MNWSAIKDDRCPRCNEKFHEPTGMLDSHRYCSGSHCLFKIGIDKFNKIKGDELKRHRDTYDPDENLSALNNM